MDPTPVPSDALNLKRNPGVDPKVLAEAERLSLELERLGIERSSSYDLAPALGGTLIRNAEQSGKHPTPATEDAGH